MRIRSGRLWIAAGLLLACDRGEREEIMALRAELMARSAQVATLQEELEARNRELAQAREEQRRCEQPPPVPLEPGPAVPEATTPVKPVCAEGRCVVLRRELEAMVSDSSALIRQARLIPSVQDGKMVGIKIYAIRPGTPLALLGFKNGDLVRSLGGVAIDSIETVLRTFDDLKQRDSWTIAGERKGVPFEVMIELQ